jgi:hypothetical protein
MGAPDRPLVEGRVMPATDQEPFMLDEARAGVRRDGEELIAPRRARWSRYGVMHTAGIG